MLMPGMSASTSKLHYPMLNIQEIGATIYILRFILHDLTREPAFAANYGAVKVQSLIPSMSHPSVK
jgi:hypothetical protein